MAYVGNPAEAELADFYAELGAAHLHPLWTITDELLTATPRPKAIPWLWQAKTLHALADRALVLIPVERGGERRVLSLGNPGLHGSPYAAGTLWGAVQCLRPGELAPAHRHSPGAIRFVLEGEGVWTTVNGDACDMRAGDLVLTPSWNWHEHTGGAESGMLWFDGLDLPMVEALDAIFFEPYPELRQPEPDEHNRSLARYRDGELFASPAVTDALHPAHSPLLIYPWAATDARLTELLRESAEPMASLEFVNPENGASVLPTLTCAMHRIRAGGTTLPVQRVGNAIFVVYAGSGASVIDGVRYDWSAGDIFVTPSWSTVEHHADEQADLFALADTPVLRALGLYREAWHERPQEVHEVFGPGSADMRLAIFDERRLGAVIGDEIVDVTAALPWDADPDPLTAGWWRRLCRDFDQVSSLLGKAAEAGPRRALDSVRLRAPALNPSKVVACASNYAAHVEEMHGVQQRTLGGVSDWMMNFDVFLKAPSSIIGPSEDIVLPPQELAAGHEIHHESELVIVIGVGGRDIPVEDALGHVRGYLIGLDITVRSQADRSRRKSHDTFSPVGPWLTTADEVPDPGDLDITLACDGEVRQAVNTGTLITPVPQVVAYASSMMTLLPGDLIFTGAPPGVGPIAPGDVLDTAITGLGRMRHQVR